VKQLARASLPTFVVDTRLHAERAVADEIVSLLRAKPSAVLGLATGNSPIGVYRELCVAAAGGSVSFARTTTFNLDEYLDLDARHACSFRRWMEERFFAHVKPLATHFPEVGGVDTPPTAVGAEYERAIRASGGIDLQLLGIGCNGHIGFNEPGARRETLTRVVDLHPLTRELAAPAFGGIERVPRRAITMGVGTILDARRIRVLAFGAEKAEIVKRALQGEVSPDCPASFLREHGDVKLFVDREAASALEAFAR
jgi:glucosamine-6-phosphate deaminase